MVVSDENTWMNSLKIIKEPIISTLTGNKYRIAFGDTYEEYSLTLIEKDGCLCNKNAACGFWCIDNNIIHFRDKKISFSPENMTRVLVIYAEMNEVNEFNNVLKENSLTKWDGIVDFKWSEILDQDMLIQKLCEKIDKLEDKLEKIEMNNVK